MDNGTSWKIEQHTLAKHELLRRYLDAWFPILSYGGNSGDNRLIFLDGFAGTGKYADGEPGSPIIALESLVRHDSFEKMLNTEFIFLFIEQDPDHFASLERELASFWVDHGGKPKNITVYTWNDEFKNVATEITSTIQGQLAPTLAFVDPFGWSGVPMTTIRDLLSSDKCEVIFNFMYDSVNRFITVDNPKIEQQFIELFGTDKDTCHQVSEFSGDQRKEYLRDLYMKQLQTVGGFRFVRSFEVMHQQRNRTLYYLMYGTRHRKGLEKMKEAMWAIDPIRGTRFSGDPGNQQTLVPGVPDFGYLQKVLIKRFSGQTALIETIERFVIEETDYKKTHYKRVLKELEEQNRISCETERKRRCTYPTGTILRFKMDG